MPAIFPIIRQVSSKVLCNGGGIVAETPALPNNFHGACLSSGVPGNITVSSYLRVTLSEGT
jgi:hypothetical protein